VPPFRLLSPWLFVVLWRAMSPSPPARSRFPRWPPCLSFLFLLFPSVVCLLVTVFCIGACSWFFYSSAGVNSSLSRHLRFSVTFWPALTGRAGLVAAPYFSPGVRLPRIFPAPYFCGRWGRPSGVSQWFGLRVFFYFASLGRSPSLRAAVCLSLCRSGFSVLFIAPRRVFGRGRSTFPGASGFPLWGCCSAPACGPLVFALLCSFSSVLPVGAHLAYCCRWVPVVPAPWWFLFCSFCFVCFLAPWLSFLPSGVGLSCSGTSPALPLILAFFPGRTFWPLAWLRPAFAFVVALVCLALFFLGCKFLSASLVLCSGWLGLAFLLFLCCFPGAFFVPSFPVGYCFRRSLACSPTLDFSVGAGAFALSSLRSSSWPSLWSSSASCHIRLFVRACCSLVHVPPFLFAHMWSLRLFWLLFCSCSGFRPRAPLECTYI